MKRFTVNKPKKISGEITAPGDKSISHRALIFSSLSSGKSAIKGLCSGEDAYRTMEIFKSLGIGITGAFNTEIVVEGRALDGLSEADRPLYAGNSGTTMRLMTGLLSAQPFFSVISGDVYLNRRPMKRVVTPLSQMGAEIYGRDGGNLAPLAIAGKKLSGMDYRMSISSAQVKSAIMLAGLFADGKTAVVEPVKSRDHTERMLKYLGCHIDVSGNRIEIEPAGRLPAMDYFIPGDISSAAFFIAAGLLVKDSEMMIRNVGINPTRTGFLDIIQQMGAKIAFVDKRQVCGEPVADIVVRYSSLRGVDISGDVIPRAIDELPLLAVCAALAEGTTVIKDAQELRVKESDRIAAMAAELKKCGVEVEEFPDGMMIQGRETLTGAICSSYGDHRVAMSMAVAGLCCEGSMTVNNCECIETSFPEFQEMLKKVSE